MRMCMVVAAAAARLALASAPASGQRDTVEHRLDNITGLEAVGVRVNTVSYLGRTAVHVINPPATAEGAIVLVAGTEMLNGTIELDVAGRPMAGATPDVRGFIGLAFRATGDS